MAGGKETPRQRLIGLMYIVFLAMLALQVSSAIIQKFEFLNNSLETAVANAKTLNQQKLEGIQKAVTDNPKYKIVYDQAASVKTESEGMIAYIEGLKKEMIEGTGGKDEGGHYNGAKETEKVMHLMMGEGEKKNGKAYALKKKLDEYVLKMRTMTGVAFPMLANDAKDESMFAKDPEQKRKDFATLNFEETPMIASLAVLSDKQARIANMQAQVLGELATKVGATDYKFDNIKAFYAAKSSTVAAGTDYEADMFIMATSSSIVPTMKFKGSSIKVEDGGFGKIKFKANAGAYDKDGNSKQNWQGTITIKKPTGDGDTTYSVTGEYIVAKPVIDVKSGAVSALYKNCGNPLNIQVPALGATYLPSFSATGASVINGAQKGEITVIPTGDKVSIGVNSGGASIGKVEFPVRAVPRPTLEVRQSGAPIDLRRGLNAPGPAMIEVVPVPDASFAGALPKEARYRVASGEVALARGKSPVARFPITANGINLQAIRAQARPGDRIVIEIKTVQRLNFRNSIEEINIPSNIGVFTLSLN